MRLRVKEYARKKGLTMRDVSDIMGCTHQIVMRWNQGRATPSIDMLLKLSIVLGCNMEDLIEE